MTRRAGRTVNIWQFTICLGLIIVVGLGVWLSTKGIARAASQESIARSSRTPQIQAGEGKDWDMVAEKLDEVIAGQEKVLAQFDTLMDELAIAKTRATRRRAP